MVTLVKASKRNKEQLEKLLDQYLSELNTHREVKVGATDSTTYPYLDSYWKEEGRHPYLFYHNNKLVGFSFIRDPKSTESLSSQVSEFYVVPEKRGLGVGKYVVLDIFEMFPGHWELQVHNNNKAAIGFWEKCISLRAKYQPNITRILSDDGSRIQYNFEV